MGFKKQHTVKIVILSPTLNQWGVSRQYNHDILTYDMLSNDLNITLNITSDNDNDAVFFYSSFDHLLLTACDNCAHGYNSKKFFNQQVHLFYFLFTVLLFVLFVVQ